MGLVFGILVVSFVLWLFRSASGLAVVLHVTPLVSSVDADHDGINDYSDIVQSARAQIGVVTSYDTAYYSGGFPPADLGACADVVWRALLAVGYDFKTMIDEDIVKNFQKYPSESLQDANINFRRVKNIQAFFQQHAEILTTQVVPGDVENLQQWQGGDLVTFEQIPGGLWHIAIVSDKRRSDGVPLLIHNFGYGVQENDYLLNWPAKISGHYRWKLKNL